MQLSFDGADRLVELVEARRGPVPAERRGPHRSSRSRRPRRRSHGRCSTMSSRRDARLAWRGAAVGLADPPGAALLLEHASFVVFDLETTGLSPAPLADRRDRRPAGEALEAGATFETLVNPGVPLPTAITALTGIAQGDVRGAPPVDLAVRRFLVVRRRRRPRRPQCALRHGLPRPRRRAADRPAGRGSGGRHRLARPAAAERADEAVRPRAPRALLRDVASSRVTGRSPTQRRPPRS